MSFTDQRMTELALEKFAPLQEGKRPVSDKKLATKYQCGEDTIRAAYYEAFQRGLVKLRSLQDAVLKPTRVADLERELQSQFRRLERAIVVQCETPPLHDESAARRYRDDVHKLLGYAMAQYFSDASFFRDDDVIGLGSGRAVYYCVRSLADFNKLFLDGIKIVSLSGSVYASDHLHKADFYMDADNHLPILASRIARRVVLVPVCNSIAPNNLAAARANAWFYGGDFDSLLPTTAVIGAGVLEAGHRFYDSSAAVGNASAAPELKVDKAALSRLIALCAQHRSDADGYVPVADICNRLFFVPPPKGHKLPPDAEREIRGGIEQINKQLLTLNEEQLCRIGRVALIAGTRSKALPIQYLLSRRGAFKNLNVKLLCTDAVTAKLLLKLEAADEKPLSATV